jgi:uncharacterized protein (TIGR02246 family)
MHRPFALVLVALLLACSSSHPVAHPSQAEDEAAVSAAMNDYVATLRTNDATKIVSFWTEDGTLINKTAPTLAGRTTMEQVLKGVFATARISKVTLDRDDLSVSGDLAYVIGRFDEVIQPAKGEQIASRGRAIYIWKRQPDGAWKIARVVATDLAAAPAAPAAARDSSGPKG